VSCTLGNGLHVAAERMPGTGVFSATLSMAAGSRYETGERSGLASLTAGLLVEGTEFESGPDFARGVESLGASLDVTVDYEACEVTVTGLAENAGECLRVVGTVARAPRVRGEELERSRRKQLAEIAEDLDDPFTAARLEFMSLVYGTHPRGRPVSGRPATVSKLDLDDVRAFRRAFHVPGASLLAVAGDVDPERIPPMAERAMAAWEGDAPAPAPHPLPAASGGQRRYVSRDRRQTHVMVGGLGVARSDPDYLAVSVMDVILGEGAGFGSRLGRRLREGEGLAYVVESDAVGASGIDHGVVWVYTATSPGKAGRALDVLREELELLRRLSPSGDEVARARSYLRGRRLRAGESCEERAARLIRARRYDLGDDYEERYAQALESVSPDLVRDVAELLLDPARHSTVVVGPSRPW